MSKTWYAATWKDDFLGIKKGDQVFYRDLTFRQPLAVGPCIVVLRTQPQLRSIRLAKSLGITSVAVPFPNAVNPRVAPEDTADVLEERLAEWLEKFPVAQRHSPREYKRIQMERAVDAAKGIQ